jgi:hypothetical protein
VQPFGVVLTQVLRDLGNAFIRTQVVELAGDLFTHGLLDAG